MKNTIALMALSISAGAFAADTAPEPAPAPAAKAAPVAAPVPAVAAPDSLASARAAIKTKDWAKAIDLLKARTAAEPRNADAFNLLGYSLRKQSKANLPKAFEAYEAALKLDPNHKGAHEYIGEAYVMEGKLAEAKKHLALLEKICGNKTCEEYEDLAKAIQMATAKK